MAQEWLKKYLRIKPEVHKIYDDLEQYLDYCRINLLNFNEADLYNERAWIWKNFQKWKNWQRNKQRVRGRK